MRLPLNFLLIVSESEGISDFGGSRDCFKSPGPSSSESSPELIPNSETNSVYENHVIRRNKHYAMTGYRNENLVENEDGNDRNEE